MLWELGPPGAETLGPDQQLLARYPHSQAQAGVRRHSPEEEERMDCSHVHVAVAHVPPVPQPGVHRHSPEEEVLGIQMAQMLGNNSTCSHYWVVVTP